VVQNEAAIPNIVMTREAILQTREFPEFKFAFADNAAIARYFGCRESETDGKPELPGSVCRRSGRRRRPLDIIGSVEL